MDIEELEAEAEQIKQRQNRFGETEGSKSSLELIQKALEVKENQKGKPEYELSELLEPIPSEQKRHFQNLKKKIADKWKNKRADKLKSKEKSEKTEKPGKEKWWLKNKTPK